MATAHIHHPASGHDEDTPGVNRREFLYYLLGGSAALIAAGSCGAVAWFTLPRARLGKDIFGVAARSIPQPETDPIAFPEGKYWIVNIRNGLLALYGYCVFDSLLPKWNELNFRFECPGCGSKYKLDGTYIEGPANRGLDRFLIYVTTPEGTFQTPPDGSPVSIDRATEIYVDVRYKIPGPARPPRER